jgi:tRNA uridine 5-carbamoylmethylation protein Kti12
MQTNTLPEDFVFLKDMYADDYFPNQLVDKIRNLIKEVVHFIESGNRTESEIQVQLDRIINGINDLQDEFYENDSEIETVARESIGETISNVLNHFNINIDDEEAIRARDW